MFYRVREFADGIGSLLTGGLALLIGAVLGALVTVQMSSGTPYSQADLDRVADHGRAAAAGAAAKATSAVSGRPGRVVSRLQERNELLAGRLSAANGTVADLREQLDLATAAATAPAPTAAAPSTPPSVAPSASASASPSTGAAGLRVTGTLDVSWVLSAELKPWPASCSEIGSGYRVRVNAGDHTTVTLGVPTASRSTGRTTKGGTLTVSCDVTWSATLPSPMSGVYEFVAVSAATPEKPLDTALAQATELVGGKVPPLGVTFCPECSHQG